MADAPEIASASEGRYKVGEVCRLADVQPYVLRYWENEFPVLAGDRTQPGPRSYSERDLKVIQRIKTLLYVEGFTIAGAKKRLENEMRNGAPEAPPPDEGSAAAPPVSAVPPPLPEAAGPDAKARRSRTRPVAVPKSDEPELPEIFEEAVSEPAAETVPGKDAKGPDPRTGVVVHAPDPRLKTVAAELKQILAILSKKP